MSKKDGKAVLLGAKEKKGIYQIALSEDELPKNQQASAVCPANVIQILDQHFKNY